MARLTVQLSRSTRLAPHERQSCGVPDARRDTAAAFLTRLAVIVVASALFGALAAARLRISGRP
jgi:hypothetical protein